MSTSFLNGCVWTAASGGTGTFTVSSAVAPYFTPANCTNPSVSDGATYNYFAVNGTEYEIGRGVYTVSGTTLTRPTVLSSSNSGSAVNFSAAPTVYMGGPLADTLTNVKVPQSFALSGDISPAQITANQNDYNPTGLAGASVLRLSSDASHNITGLAGGADGRVIVLVNVDVNNLVLKDASTSSSAGNRFVFGADITLAPKQSVTLWYDATNSGWRPIAQRTVFGTAAALDVGTTANKVVQLDGSAKLPAVDGSQLTNLAAGVVYGQFYKKDWTIVAFTKTGAGTISILAGTKIELAGTIYSYAADTAVQMPTLTAGTDYAIYQCNDGTVRADASFSAPSGFSTTTSRKIGGFHYAAGGNATGTSGGDTTAAINAYSLWDLKFRPSAYDPRGMALVSDRFWCDIYLLGVNHHTDGTSKYGVTIADGSSPPKVPTAFGGNGSTTYSTLTWWEAVEVLAAYGKELLCYDELAAAAYGTTENGAVGSDPGTTGLDAARTSKWGIMQATGNMWVWGRDFGGPYGSAAWSNTNGGRGQIYNQPDAVFLGGSYADGANAGSRAAFWGNAPSTSNLFIGARGRCDHVCHV